MTEKEIEKIRELVKQYHEINSQADLMQRSIESLAKRRDDLFEELSKIKKEEKEFIDKMTEKYGASEVTPNKLLKLML